MSPPTFCHAESVTPATMPKPACNLAFMHPLLRRGVNGVTAAGGHVAFRHEPCLEIQGHRAPDGGNAAIAGLIHIARANDFVLIDVQMQSPHVMRFGASLMSTDTFAAALREALSG